MESVENPEFDETKSSFSNIDPEVVKDPELKKQPSIVKE